MLFLLIIGGMFAGKTTMLLKTVEKYKKSGKKCVLIKHKKDWRYIPNSVCTHDQHHQKANLCSTTQEIELLARQNDVVAIDEAHFFTNISEIVQKLLDQGKTVVVAGLNSKSPWTGFENIADLLHRADEIIHLRANCDYCANKANFSLRITPIPADGDTVGGKESYRACCRNCYIEQERKQEQS